MKRLAWIDLETTGRDETTGCILEVGLVITNEKLEVEAEFYALVEPAPETIINAHVAQMHQDNGLLDDLARGHTYVAEVVKEMVSVERANMEMFNFIRLNDTRASVIGLPLAGSCPSFDRTWLRYHMPQVEALFSHCHFDVSTLRILHDVKRPEGHKAPHRVMADIAEDIELTKRFLPAVS